MPGVYLISIIIIIIMGLIIGYSSGMDKDLTLIADYKCHWYDIYMTIVKIIFFFSLGFIICRQSMI